MGSVLGAVTGKGGGGGSMPKAPDYKGAAEATAQGNLDYAQQAAAANRVNQQTPWGSLTYSSAGKDENGNPIYNQTLSLSPEQQQLLNYQNQASLGLGNLTNQGLQYVQNQFSTPFDTSNLPARSLNPGQTGQDAIMARLEPQFNKDQDRLQNQLLNQGLQPGSEAYRNAMTQFNQGKNDAYSQAALQGISLQDQARNSALQEDSFLRNQPLNELNALRAGSQLTQPTFNATPQQATTAGPNYLGAADAQYQALLNAYSNKTASNNALMGGLFNLGGAAIGAFSDRRLKKNIKRVGTHTLGIGIYVWEYLWGEPAVGVMSDELKLVKPSAVHTHPSGYEVVNYGAL